MIRVNGADQPLKERMLLSDFLKEAGYQKGRIAVELNEKIIPKSQYDQTWISDGDVLEVVSFVGGG
nr:sulfur carrier protein ThiS [uncultured Merdimonas sp.]